MGGYGRCCWNDARAASNLRKHGIAFVDVADLFGSAFMVVRRDRRRDYGEDRFNALMNLQGLIINVTFTPRASHFQLISVRPANRSERAVYAATSKSDS